MKILNVENLVKTYGNGENIVHAVDHVSFSVEKGEFVAIVGASGSGKSTLMHMIGGVDIPTGGHIFVDGQEITGMNAEKLAIFRRRQIGVVYQFYNLIPILTAEENITLPIDLDGRKTDQKRLDELLKTLGIEDKRHSLPNQLSGGQQQRVSIARALITEPALLLADEPTGNLDSKATEDIVGLLKMSNKNFGQTVIMITHNLEIAAQADRILTMSDGRLSEEGGK
ncbi:MAG: ABC transporter ATP-binding protein [Clostridia bacterium]|nr:ABC transporter ATP-binding protein [Clostridia bacterium]